MRKTDNLECYRIFCAVAARGSVKEAAMGLFMEPSNIFRLLRQIEADLGVPLFERLSRPMRLTAQGEIFFDCARRMLEDQSHMIESIRDNLESESGMIQIASTSGVRRQLLTPMLVEYQELNPGVSVELRDMVQGSRNFFIAPDGSLNDIVITYRTEAAYTEGAHVEELIDVPFVACASPLYVNRHGAPDRPSSCDRHRGILLRLPSRTTVTHLAQGGGYERLSWQSTTTCSSQLDAIEALVLGGGVCPDIALPYFIEEYRRGRLVPVMNGWSCPARMVCLYASANAWRKRRVRSFTEWFGVRYKAHINDCLSTYRSISEGAAPAAAG